MNNTLLRILFWIILSYNLDNGNSKKYTPDWASLDSRVIPKWFDEAKVGIMLHWGVYSVPSFWSEWFWWDWQGNKPIKEVTKYMNKFYPPTFSYVDFGKDFKAEFFDPNHWLDIFKSSGARYVVFTSKHHEGFCNWPSSTSWNWNSFDMGPRRDIVGELADVIRKYSDIKFGLYYSLFEWFNPIYLADSASGFKYQNFVKKKSMPELIEIVERYKPSIIWSDGDTNSSVYWRSKEFLAWLYNDSPVRDTVVTNDRWGQDANCKHGDFLNCADRYHPKKLLSKKWEMCMTLDKYSWGFRREAKLDDILTLEELIETLVNTVVYGGNILVNVGPTSWGRITPIYEYLLKGMGDWLRLNGEGIYNTTPWQTQIDSRRPKLWYNCKKLIQANVTETIVYAYFSSWSENNPPSIYLSAILVTSKNASFRLLDGKDGRKLPFNVTKPGVRGVTISLPKDPPLSTHSVWIIEMKDVL